jgi:hypothetical protein
MLKLTDEPRLDEALSKRRSGDVARRHTGLTAWSSLHLEWYQRAARERTWMSRNTSITLGDHFADFVDQQVTTVRYMSASDVVERA